MWCGHLVNTRHQLFKALIHIISRTRTLCISLSLLCRPLASMFQRDNIPICYNTPSYRITVIMMITVNLARSLRDCLYLLK